jgi:putative ABC transport system ATP-binding protein
VLEVANLSYRYTPEKGWAVRQAALALRAGDSVALTGPSGCGKSTLLLLCAGILGASDGSVKVCGQDLVGASANERADVRRASIGLVFQFGELVAELSLKDNVALVAELAGSGRSAALERADALLREVGLSDVADSRPGDVSGGQAQRCAVARALIHEPALVLADEPTGSLDQRNAQMVMGMLSNLCARRGTALLVATHDEGVAAACSARMRMLDGRLSW